MDEETVARSRIAALIAELTSLGDAGKIDAFSELFAEDGTYTLQNRTVAKGSAAIKRMLSDFSKNMARLEDAAPKYMRHHITTSHVEILGEDTARADTYFLKRE